MKSWAMLFTALAWVGCRDPQMLDNTLATPSDARVEPDSGVSDTATSDRGGTNRGPSDVGISDTGRSSGPAPDTGVSSTECMELLAAFATSEAIAATPRPDAAAEQAAAQFVGLQLAVTDEAYERASADLEAIYALGTVDATVVRSVLESGPLGPSIRLYLTAEPTFDLMAELARPAVRCVLDALDLDVETATHEFLGRRRVSLILTSTRSSLYSSTAVAEILSRAGLVGFRVEPVGSGADRSFPFVALYHSGTTLRWIIQPMPGFLDAECYAFDSSAPGVVLEAARDTCQGSPTPSLVEGFSRRGP